LYWVRSVVKEQT